MIKTMDIQFRMNIKSILKLFNIGHLCEPLSVHPLKSARKKYVRKRTHVRKGLNFFDATWFNVCYIMHWNSYIFKHSLIV